MVMHLRLMLNSRQGQDCCRCPLYPGLRADAQEALAHDDAHHGWKAC
jgi:hypothetical protein